MIYRIETETHMLDDGSQFHVVRHPDLPGCHGFGGTYDDAMDRLALARQAYLGVLHDMGAPPPKSGISIYFSDEPAVAGQQEAERAYA